MSALVVKVRKGTLEWALCWMVSILVRLCLSTGPHSGRETPPMYGDYEAQRHWMELTVNLPVSEWYVNSRNNDLQYWGLDYPPLTAYHSWLMGKIAQTIDASWVALHDSRGMETPEHRVFMRCTVLLADLLILFPAIYLLVTKMPAFAALDSHVIMTKKGKRGSKSGAKHLLKNDGGLPSQNSPVKWALILSLYPGLLLIDHGHFQYNNISLGLFLLTFVCLTRLNRPYTAAALFALALNYKQMELYHALPIFSYILGHILAANWRQNGPLKTGWEVFKVGIPVLIVFGALWTPFIATGTGKDVLARVFPFARGIFEDKVANFWCALSVLFKWRRLLSLPGQIRLCGAVTLALALPSNLMLLIRPQKPAQFAYCLTVTSLTFFLFSFHVHEKSILLVSTAVYSLYGTKTRLCPVATHFLLIALISLHPLVIKDGLKLPFWVLTLVFYFWTTHQTVGNSQLALENRLYLPIFHGSVIFALLLAALPIFLTPPVHLPDLFTMFLCMYCASGFILFLGLFYWLQIWDFWGHGQKLKV